MRVDYRVFHAPKRGNAADEYEDAYWPPGPLNVAASTFRCAVADGATETSFAGMWASSLVRSWCRGWLSGAHSVKHLEKLKSRWQREVSSRPLPWYAEEKVKSGAFSSLLGLSLYSAKAQEWRAAAAGDSCLFHLRDASLVASFPYTSSEQFISRPALLGTRIPSGRQKALWQTCGGAWEREDTFLLMTDAAAHWFLASHEAGAPVSIIEPLLGDSAEESEAALDALRTNRDMRNDDVTIVCLTVMEP